MHKKTDDDSKDVAEDVETRFELEYNFNDRPLLKEKKK